MKLKEISHYVIDKINSDSINLDQYVTTDSILQNKVGREKATNLPPHRCLLTHFQKGDTLIANIRPYLKKIWQADCDGACNADVLVIRANKNSDTDFLYALLLQDSFYDYIMQGAKGSKMPRGDKNQLMDYEFLQMSDFEREQIGNFIFNIKVKIDTLKAINRNLEALARQLYDYWFVQFDFPDENGRPYKTSGGKMVWNEKLKREIPEGWGYGKVKEFITQIERGISYSSDDLTDNSGFPMINLACFAKSGEYRQGELKFLKNKNTNNVKALDLLIACTDMTQNADIIGRPIFVTNEYPSFSYSTDLAKITPLNLSAQYLYYTLRTPYYHKYIKPFASGTTVKHLNLYGVENYQIVIPDEEIQKKFDDLSLSIKTEQNRIINEIMSLVSQRDHLLPFLMNGQVSVKLKEINCDLSPD